MSNTRHHGCGRGRTCGLCRPWKRWRGNFKKFGNDNSKQLIRKELAEAGSAAEIDRELRFDEEADEASYCHHHGPCPGCRAKNTGSTD